MHGVCVVYALYMHDVRMAYAWHMRGICMAAGDHYNGGCCFDYGNAEIDALDDGKGTMEAFQP